jgi:ABC-type amino acid transport substrate-binding protein
MNDDVYAAVAGRNVDAAVDDSPIASWFVRNRPDLALVSPIPGTEAQYALMVAPNHVTLRTALDHALSQIRQDGQYAAIHRQWFGERSE